MTGFLSRRVEFHYAGAFHAQLKTLILQHVLPKWLLFSSITVASRNTCVRPPRTADTLQLSPPIINPPPTPTPATLVRSFSPFGTNPQSAGLMETFPKRFVLCNRDACLENPGCKHFPSPGRYTQLFLLQDSASRKGYPS